MNLDLSAFLEGVDDALAEKQAADLFSSPNGALFPAHQAQSKWKFARGADNLRLSDGTNAWHFDFPEGQHEDQDFHAHRAADPQMHEFHQGALSSGTAQVHRSDPGSIYLTLQEGKANPTYTIKHMGGEKWKVIPKARKLKPVPLSAEAEVFKQALVQDIASAGNSDDWDRVLGRGVSHTVNAIQHGLLSPGRNWNTPWSGLSGGLGAAAIGAGAGGAYHLGKRYLYNTREENEEEAEEGWTTPLKRIGLPALAALGVSASQGSLFPKYYQHAAIGQEHQFDALPLPRMLQPASR